MFEKLDLEIPVRQVSALYGPNGCGKSTILKSMRGALPLSSGAAKITGAPVTGWSAKELARAGAMLGQPPSAAEDMTVREIVTLGRYAPSSGLRRAA